MARCEAKNNPGCYIECNEGGCLAKYRTPAGPCVTRCGHDTGSEPLTLENNFSIAVSDLSSATLANWLTNYLPDELSQAMTQQNRNLTFSFETTPKKLIEFLSLQFSLSSNNTIITPTPQIKVFEV